MTIQADSYRGTGIRGDGENLHGSTQRVTGTSPVSAVLTGGSSSGRPSFQVNVSGSGSGGASSGGQVSACAGEERPSLFSDSGKRPYHHWVQQNGMKLSLWGLLNF